MISIKNPYPSVRADEKDSYGGNQGEADRETMRRCGCGVVAGLDLLLYLSKYHGDCIDDELENISWPIKREIYNSLLREMSRKYLPLLYPVGMNGVTLAFGLNRYFRDHAYPFRARWCVRGEKIWQRIEELLENDLPVILSVGPNFPYVWQKNRTAFYKKTADGRYFPAAAAKSHYITVTGIDDDWMKISSWGKEYYINRKEYSEYISDHSNSFVSNIIFLTKK